MTTTQSPPNSSHPAALPPLTPQKIQSIHDLLTLHPLIHPTSSKSGKKIKFSYGTAGFRYDAKYLPPLFVRIGLFAAIRSASLNGDHVGLMCTASHNPPSDNGIKLSDPDGGMLHSSWEKRAVLFANASPSHLSSVIARLLSSSSSSSGGPPMVVHVGRDTRRHSRDLISLAQRAAESLGAVVIDHGAVTTPQLHHFVMHANGYYLPGLIPRREGEEGYFDLLSHGFVNVCGSGGGDDGGRAAARRARRWRLTVDASCGVGYDKIATLSRRGGVRDLVDLRPFNAPADGILNERCGAEYVQKMGRPPFCYEEGRTVAAARRDEGDVGCSLDGDADRIVFWYHNAKGQFRLLDGDKIAILVAGFIKEELKELSMSNGRDLKLGVVQTAYANGASTAFLRDKLDVPIKIAKTGVKYVHHAAQKHFDVGVYFEANGHGTVLFNSKFYSFLYAAEKNILGKRNRQMQALQRLRVLPSLINQGVGDALSDLLLVIAILILKQWNFEMWDNLYDDLPSCQLKVSVHDRSTIKTNENETRVIEPFKLQVAIDSLVSKFQEKSQSSLPRCFVRPSGTENVVRIYSEATTKDDATSLAEQTASLVTTLCGGDDETIGRSKL